MENILIALGIFLALCVPVIFKKTKNKPLDNNEFAALVMKIWKQQEPDVELAYDEESYSIIVTNRDDFRMNLYNLSLAAKDLKAAERRQAIIGFLDSLNAHSIDVTQIEDIHTHLFPRIRDLAGYYAIKKLGLTAGQEMDIFNVDTIDDHLHVEIVVDTPKAMTSLSRESASKLDMSDKEIYQIALHNLRQASENFQFLETGGVYMSNFEDSYDASRMLLPELLQKLPVEGETVVIPWSRDHILISGTAKPEALASMAEMIKSAGEVQYPICPLPFILTEKGQWKRWNIPDEYPCKQAFSDLERIWYSDVYASQKEWLEEKFELDLEPRFVSSYMVMSKGSNETPLKSLATWTETVVAALPKTDMVVFNSPHWPKEESVIVEWEKAQEIAGDLMVPSTEYGAVRYLVDNFPVASQIEQLKMAAM